MNYVLGRFDSNRFFLDTREIGIPDDVQPQQADYLQPQPASDAGQQQRAADYIQPQHAADYIQPQHAADYIRPQHPQLAGGVNAGNRSYAASAAAGVSAYDAPIMHDAGVQSLGALRAEPVLSPRSRRKRSLPTEHILVGDEVSSLLSSTPFSFSLKIFIKA